MKILHKVQDKTAFIREHSRGDVRSDGKVFESYRYMRGKVYERWCLPEQLVERKALSSKSARAWAIRPENKPRMSEYAKVSNAKRRKLVPVKFMVTAARKRAKDKGLPFNIEESDLIIPAACPVLGIPLIVGEAQSDNSPSLDRLIPELGYIKGNVRVISRRANRIKNDATPDELYKVWKYAVAVTT